MSQDLPIASGERSRPVERLVDSCASTNDIARELALAGAPHGSWVSARRQDSGRGRLGRGWVATEGDLLLSLIIRVPGMDRLSWIPLAAAVGVCRAIREQLPGAEPRIKWPNDIWWSGAKAGGILCEGSSNAHGPFVIVGLGLNCVDFPRGVPAASIPANVSELRPKIIHHALAAIDSLFDFSPSERGPTDAIVPAALSQEYESVALLSPGTRVAWGSGEGPVPGLKTGRGLTGTVLRVGSRGELWVLPDPVSGTPPAEATALYAEDVRIRDLPEASAKSPA